MTMNMTDTNIEGRRQAALAELREHQDRKQREQAASAEGRIERAVQAARAEQEREEPQRRTSAELARIMESTDRRSKRPARSTGSG